MNRKPRPRPSATRIAAAALAAPLALTGCGQLEGLLGGDDTAAAQETAALYQTAAVERRDITVAVAAAGIVEPVTTVDVKSKASGEILSLPVDTGDQVQAGALLANIDPRVLDNSLQQAQANLEVAKARLTNSSSQLERIDKLYQKDSLSKADWEQAALDYAQANSEVVRSEIQVENATIALDDTKVGAPITGTVIERFVEQGQVISSPMGDVGGGTLLLRMADLSTVQVRMLVDEIDIGKVNPGVNATVNVAAFANRPFQGEVAKVEPQAVAEQNVTMFPVLIDLDNSQGLLKPGMNAEVELLVARRVDVATIPNAALRTQDDIFAAGMVLGLEVDTVREMLAAAPRPQGVRSAGASDGPPADRREQMRAIFGKMRAGQELTEEEQKLADEMRRRMAERGGGRGGAGGFGGRGFGGGAGGAGGEGGGRRTSAVDAQFGGDYLVFALRDSDPIALHVRTGITDLDRTEVVFGLEENDEVLILPSASLVRAQESFQQRMKRWNSIPGLNRQSGGGRGRG